MTYYLSHIEHEILLALAWAAPLTSKQLRRIAAPKMPRTTFEKRLSRLRRDRHIESDWWYEEGWQAKRLSLVWNLTGSGAELIENNTKEPFFLARKVRSSLLNHDLMLSELLTCLIERSRHILSGIYFQRETRLDEERRKPTCDAILIVRRNPEYATPTAVPWLAVPPAPSEGIKGYAVEIDRDTEPLGIIRGKAESYSAVWIDSTFYQRYGRLPLPLWVVPTVRRQENIMRVWQEAWEPGQWMITTDAAVHVDEWHEYKAGVRRVRPLLDSWELQPTEVGASIYASPADGRGQLRTARWAEES